MLRPIPSLLNVLFAATLALALGACAKKNDGSAGGAGTYGGSDSDFVSGSPLPERQEGVSFLSPNVDRNRFEPVYFEFDSYTVRGADRGKIDAVASYLREGGGSVIIAGFTDERGTPEYNRGLGERRAQAVRQALIGAGADGGRLQTVSFGAEMPADPGSGESAWAKNRRAEFGVVR
jgi:peptidoglycan-associated lipoprotein